jgi:putative transposase
VESAGAADQVMDRGDRQENICRSEEDRVLFLRTLGEACGRTGYADLLTGNHYRPILDIPEAGISLEVEGLIRVVSGHLGKM